MQQHKEPDFDEPSDEEDSTDSQNDKIVNFKTLTKDENQFLTSVNELNQQAIVKVRKNNYKEALKLLSSAEKMLEFAASCGKPIDRNLIIVVLYNEACAYQCSWILDKCSKYIDGVIYNLELSIKEEQQEILQTNSQSESVSRDLQSLTVKRQSFLARAYLQYCAILSQLGRHKSALENAKKAAHTMRELFKVAYEFCKEQRRAQVLIGSANSTQSTFNTNKQRAMSGGRGSSKQDDSISTRQIYTTKDEVAFAKLVVDQAYDILQEMSKQEGLENMSLSEKEQFNEAKRQLYYWRNNPENNEKHIRKELKVPSNARDDDFRSLLGVSNVKEWIENFNIGSIMHMEPLNYEDFQSYGEMIYEISKRVLLEKVIYLSISYFTIATEIRFIEIEKAKQQGISDKDIRTDEFKLSEIYHLKAIEIACKHVMCSSPYINHLITSYHKHYNQNLDTIMEESFCSQLEVSVREKKTQKRDQSIPLGTGKSSPTSKLLQSMVPPRNNPLLEQMLKVKSGVSPPINNLFSASPFKQQKGKNILAKRDSSPMTTQQLQSARTQTVPTLSFLQNALALKQGNQSIDKKVGTTSNSQQDVTESSFSIQPQQQTLQQIYQPKSTRNQLNNLLSGQHIRPSSSKATENHTLSGYFSYRQNSGPTQNQHFSEICQTQRPNESLSPKLQRSPQREDTQLRKGRINSRDRKMQQPRQNLKGKGMNVVGSVLEKRDSMQPIRLETIQQFQQLLRNGQQKRN